MPFAKNKSEASFLPRGSRGAPHARACTTWLPLQCAVLQNRSLLVYACCGGAAVVVGGSAASRRHACMLASVDNLSVADLCESAQVCHTCIMLCGRT